MDSRTMTAKKSKKPNTLMAAIVSAKQYKAKTKKRAKKVVKLWTLQHRVSKRLFGLTSLETFASKEGAEHFRAAFKWPENWQVVRVRITVED